MLHHLDADIRHLDDWQAGKNFCVSPGILVLLLSALQWPRLKHSKGVNLLNQLRSQNRFGNGIWDHLLHGRLHKLFHICRAVALNLLM